MVLVQNHKAPNIFSCSEIHLSLILLQMVICIRVVLRVDASMCVQGCIVLSRI